MLPADCCKHSSHTPLALLACKPPTPALAMAPISSPALSKLRKAAAVSWSFRKLPSKIPVRAEKKTNKQKTHKHFSDGPCGTIVPGTNPHPSQGQTGQNGDFTVELNRERPVCPRDRSQFVPGRGPVCPRDGSCLSRTPSLPKCLCLLVFFLARSREEHSVDQCRSRLKTLTSLNKEVRPLFLSDNSIWSYPSLSSLSDYSIWRS